MPNLDASKLELSESSFKIRSFPEYVVKPMWYDITTARLLSLIDNFYNDVCELRKILQLDNEYLEYPESDFFGLEYDEDGLLPSTLYILRYRYIETISKNTGLDIELVEKTLLDSVSVIVKKYKLTHRWSFPIQILVLTDTLNLPFNSPIYVKPPIMENSVLEVVGEKFESLTSRAVDSKHNLTIIVTEKMTMNELVDQLRADKVLMHAISRLPAANRPRIKDNALYWGHIVWSIKVFVDPSLSWQKIHSKILDTKPDSNVPDRLELAVYYKRFINAINKFL